VSAEPDPQSAPRALLALYDEALPDVYGYFVRRCADRTTAEDLTSETFLAAMDAARRWGERSDGGGEDSPPPMTVPWLIGVARHKLADHYRRRHDRFSVPVAELAELIGRTVHATEALLVRARRAFKKEYPTPEGRTS
jgi:RNA polymerase sigma-70 factor (ECF subfamily)